MQLSSNSTLRKVGRLTEPVFVVGCPRSGTTLLGACLGAHSALAGADESIFLRHLARIYYGFFIGDSPRSWQPLRAFISEQDLLDSLGTCADTIFSSLLKTTTKCRYVDHTPWYINLMPFIDLLYPDAQFIHIIRDGRRVVDSLASSYRNGFLWAGASVRERTQLWLNSVVTGRNAGKLLGEGRYKEIRYERICTEPHLTLQETLAYLRLPMEADVLRPLSTPHAKPSTCNLTLATIDNNGKLRLTPRLPQGSWPTSWTSEERGEFATIGEVVLRELGYA
jgi:hypothetical protein